MKRGTQLGIALVLLLLTTSAMTQNKQEEEIILGGGCFWCIEAVFQNIEGVQEVVSGYAGGDIANPTYREVSSGRTNHAEVCKVRYNPTEIGLEKLLDVFFTVHNPTTLNRQGADVGTQYRSIILYAKDSQKDVAQKTIKKWEQSAYWEEPIVTELVPLKAFYKAEITHQDYFKNNPNAAYCRFMVKPKIEKMQQAFPDIINK